MSDRPRRQNEDELPPELAAAVDAWRTAEPPSADWRRDVLKSIERDTLARGPRWSVRPWIAVAAAVVCIAAGAAATTVLGRRATTPVAEAPATVRFTLRAPAAGKVALVGDFNGWNPAALPMHHSPDSPVWVVDVPLHAGRYAYAFVVDGSLARDPAAPQAGDDDFGSANSVILVKGS